ncbi:glycylpeptide N-tetradecanoyltransferase, partial [Tieghemiomyces parasiticus]
TLTLIRYIHFNRTGIPTCTTMPDEKRPADSDSVDRVPTLGAPAKSPAEEKTEAPAKALVGQEGPQVEALLNKMKNAETSAAYQQQLQTLLQRLNLGRSGIQDLEPRLREHRFWSTQPVPQLGEEPSQEEGAIKPDLTRDQLRQEPIPLPQGFEWVELALDEEATMKELYELLTNNYVEDDDAMFRFDYSADFLTWALKPPGWKRQWNVGVRVASSGRLVAFISGIPVNLKIRSHVKDTVEINFMCVHKKLRNKRLAPVLIKEVTRRVNLEGIFQAVYTAGAVLPTPLATCRYYHRSLNPKKLVETGFSYLPPNWTMTKLVKSCAVPTEAPQAGLRPMTAADVPSVRQLLNAFLNRTCQFAQQFSSDEELAHWLLPVDGVIWTYVADKAGEPGVVSDLVSFYALPSSVINHPTHKTINAAYLFYYATDADASDEAAFKTHLTQLMESALVFAKANGFDVFNCLEMAHNRQFIEDLRFKPGDGYLKFYLYNWRCPPVESHEVGLVML